MGEQVNQSRKILRLGVGGKWSARQVSQAVAAIDDLYSLRLLLQVVFDDTPEPLRHHLLRRRHLFPDPYFDNPWFVAKIRPERAIELVEPSERLMVRRLDYASPGSFDFAGIGAIVGHVKDFLLRLLEIYASTAQRKLENEERSLKNESLRIKNARDLIALARELGAPEQEMRRQALWVDQRQRTIEALVQSELIVSVEMRDDETTHD